jgi:hypothetical protein
MTIEELQSRVSEMRNFFAPVDSCGRRLHPRVKRPLTVEEVNALPVGALIVVPSDIIISGDGEINVIGYGVDLYLNEEGEPIEAWTDVDETIFLVAAKTDEFLQLFKIHKSGHITERGLLRCRRSLDRGFAASRVA